MNMPTVPCRHCGTPTINTSTRQCDPCHDVASMAERRPDLVAQILATVVSEGSARGLEFLATASRSLSEARSRVEQSRSAVIQFMLSSRHGLSPGTRVVDASGQLFEFVSFYDSGLLPRNPWILARRVKKDGRTETRLRTLYDWKKKPT